MSRRAMHSRHGVVEEWEPDQPQPKIEETVVQEQQPPKTLHEIVSRPESQQVGYHDVAEFYEDSQKPVAEQPLEVQDGKIGFKKERKEFFKSKRERWIFTAFIVPPIAISLISMLHMVTLFEASNVYWMAVSIAVAVELAAMSSLIALVTLDKLNKTTIWSIFGVLASLQVLGNMYHTYVNMSPESQQSILNLLALDSTPWSLRLVMFLVGGILPVIALTFVKGIVDYFKE